MRQFYRITSDLHIFLFSMRSLNILNLFTFLRLYLHLHWCSSLNFSVELYCLPLFASLSLTITVKTTYFYFIYLFIYFKLTFLGENFLLSASIQSFVERTMLLLNINSWWNFHLIRRKWVLRRAFRGSRVVQSLLSWRWHIW